MDCATRVLIIDDDPSHLRIYGWIVAAAGYEPSTALVTGEFIDFPEAVPDLVLMDYRLTTQLSAVQAAAKTKDRFPDVPIILLSDMYDLPEDVAPLVEGFVRKGEPAKLVDTLGQYLKRAEVPGGTS